MTVTATPPPLTLEPICLQRFCLVAKHRGYRRAAQAANLSTSTLRANVATLEGTLGTLLLTFPEGGSWLDSPELTEPGRELFKRTADFFESLQLHPIYQELCPMKLLRFFHVVEADRSNIRHGTMRSHRNSIRSLEDTMQAILIEHTREPVPGEVGRGRSRLTLLDDGEALFRFVADHFRTVEKLTATIITWAEQNRRAMAGSAA